LCFLLSITILLTYFKLLILLASYALFSLYSLEFDSFCLHLSFLSIFLSETDTTTLSNLVFKCYYSWVETEFLSILSMSFWSEPSLSYLEMLIPFLNISNCLFTDFLSITLGCCIFGELMFCKLILLLWTWLFQLWLHRSVSIGSL